MPALTAPDGTRLSYDVTGEGSPVICLPGGPMQESAHLGDLGGLSRHVQLVLWDYRGVGRSETPADKASYRCDRLVDDVEALREQRLEIVQRRSAEPWFPAASAAFEAIQTEQATESDWEAMTPLVYGRWDAAARAHHQRENDTRNDEAATAFGAEGAFDPPATRAALATLASPVLLLAGEVDIAAPPRVMAEYATLFPDATFVIQPEAGHLPWLDDGAWFTTTVAAFVG